MEKKRVDLRENLQARYADYLYGEDYDSHPSFEVNVKLNDISNLQYFIMMWESLKKSDEKFDFDLTIKPDMIDANPEQIKAMISSFLACYRNTTFKDKSIFFTGERGFKNSKLSKKETYGRLMPLIPVNNQVYQFLSSFVGTVFEPYFGEDYEHFTATYAPMEGEELKEKELDEREKKENRYLQIRYILQNICLHNLFYEGDVTDVAVKDLIKKRTGLFESREFFKKVKDIPFLSFFIFCAHERFSIDEGLDEIKNKSKESGKKHATYNERALQDAGLLPFGENYRDIDDALIIAQDMSDGLLQLIENIVFYAGHNETDGAGLLSLRIFKNGHETWNEYLIPNYKRYFAGEDDRLQTLNSGSDNSYFYDDSLKQREEYENKALKDLGHAELRAYDEYRVKVESRKKMRNSVPFYLEVKLVDNSGKNICDEFESKHKEREYYKFNKVTLRTFFNPTKEEREKWNDFNSEPLNIIHHYGLQLFDALVQSLDGCFMAQSFAKQESDADVKNSYSTSGDQMPEKGSLCFLGTQYIILLPFYKRERRGYSFVNTNVRYPLPPQSTEYSLSGSGLDGKPSDFFELLKKYSETRYKTQKQKQKQIIELCEKLDEFEPTGRSIFVCDSKALTPHNVELFSKAIMKFISNHRYQRINIAITNCEEEKFKQLARAFAVFYDRTGKNEFMKNTQIYISGKNSKDEFLLMGANLKSSLTAQIKLCAARGITHEPYGGIFAFLLDMLERRPGEGSGMDVPEFVPFDLLIKNNQNLSVFERNVIDVLNTDVQNKEPGCKIVPNHMRIGSKIHTDSFYEAHMLFSNNYYTGRFAWLLREILTQKLKLSPNTSEKPTVFQSKIVSEENSVPMTKNSYLFVGYETYSEMLLRDLSESFGDAEYCIFEYGTRDMRGGKTDDRFRFNAGKPKKKQYTPIFIVPINSTLSTFNKLEAELGRQNKKLDLSGAYYLGVIQTLQTDENNSDVALMGKFFEWPIEKIDKVEHKIKSKLINPSAETNGLVSVYYTFCVLTQWSDPLKCKMCYPENYIDEVPLIETDKTSVIPSQLYGLLETSDEKLPNNLPSNDGYVDSQGSIEDLDGCVIYGHTERDSKHFQFYIETDKYFNKVQNRKIKSWLEKIKERIEQPADEHIRTKLRYDIIVYPEHYSNTGFVKVVNDIVFNGASLMIGIDFEKEFRDNFKAKHSDLSSIYSNLENWDSDAEINFHFVDDTIVHGSHFLRIKSLIYSLFPVKSNDKVHINIFRSVIVLVNRNSSDSLMNFVSRKEDFFCYFNLKISSLRTHGNACVLCQEVVDNYLLSKRSSLNALGKWFYENAEMCELRDIYKEISKIAIDSYENRNNFLKLSSTHNMNKCFSALREKVNEESYVLMAIVEEITKEIKVNKKYSDVEILTSYIEVLSSPFISFRKSSREAILSLMLALFEIILNEKINTEKIVEGLINKMTTLSKSGLPMKIDVSLREFFDNIEKITDDDEKCKALIRVLIKQSISIKSNYIIRRDSIVKLLCVSVKKKFDEMEKQKERKFIDEYLYHIKRLVASGNDEAKAMFLEYLLLTGREYSGVNSTGIGKIKHIGDRLSSEWEELLMLHCSSPEQVKMIRKSINLLSNNVYIENTQIIYDAAHDLARDLNIEKIKNDYYFENYKKLLFWNNISHLDNQLNSVSFALGNIMRELERDLYKDEKILEYFTSLACKLSELMLASLRCSGSERGGAPIVCFLGERTENFLFLDTARDGIVYSMGETVLDSFACSESNKEIVGEIAKNAQNIIINSSGKEPYDGFILNTYMEEDNTSLINIGAPFREGIKQEPETEKIRIAIRYRDDYSEYEKLKALRFVLAFNNKISGRLRDAFGKLLSEELHNLRLREQMKKVQSGDHARENSRDKYDPKVLMDQTVMYRAPRGDYPYGDSELAYGYYINSTIGRINIKLLTESDENWKYPFPIPKDINNHSLEEGLCKRLTAVTRLPAKQLIVLVKKDGKTINMQSENAEKELEQYLKIEFNNRRLLKNINHQIPRFDYLIAFISELINSVKRHGKQDKDGYYHAHIAIDEDGYFCISNKTEKDFNLTKIQEGLKRNRDGISLSAICGFFDLFYRGTETDTTKYGPRVKIQYASQTEMISIKIPLLESDKNGPISN